MEKKENNMNKHLTDFLSEYINIEDIKTVTDKLNLYTDLIIEGNKITNLTRILDNDEVCIKHYLDSLLIINTDYYINAKSLADIGAGAGFPGIPLKIAANDLKADLFDSSNKRVNFLNDTISKLELSNTKAYHGRAEEFGKDNNFREKYDLVTSRAVANLPTLLEYCAGFVKPEGYIAAYKGPGFNEELSVSQKAIKELNLKVEKILEVNLPDDYGFRAIIILKKIKPLSDKYPRATNLILKKPL